MTFDVRLSIVAAAAVLAGLTGCAGSSKQSRSEPSATPTGASVRLSKNCSPVDLVYFAAVFGRGPTAETPQSGGPIRGHADSFGCGLELDSTTVVALVVCPKNCLDAFADQRRAYMGRGLKIRTISETEYVVPSLGAADVSSQDGRWVEASVFVPEGVEASVDGLTAASAFARKALATLGG